MLCCINKYVQTTFRVLITNSYFHNLYYITQFFSVSHREMLWENVNIMTHIVELNVCGSHLGLLLLFSYRYRKNSFFCFFYIWKELKFNYLPLRLAFTVFSTKPQSPEEIEHRNLVSFPLELHLIWHLLTLLTVTFCVSLKKEPFGRSTRKFLLSIVTFPVSNIFILCKRIRHLKFPHEFWRCVSSIFFYADLDIMNNRFS